MVKKICIIYNHAQGTEKNTPDTKLALEFVEYMVNILADHDVEYVYFDKEIVLGIGIFHRFNDLLSQADVILVVITPEIGKTDSGFVKFEESAVVKKLLQGTPVIPLLVGKDTVVPECFSILKYLYFDISTYRQDLQVWEVLKRSIKYHLEGGNRFGDGIEIGGVKLSTSSQITELRTETVDPEIKPFLDNLNKIFKLFSDPTNKNLKPAEVAKKCGIGDSKKAVNAYLYHLEKKSVLKKASDDGKDPRWSCVPGMLSKVTDKQRLEWAAELAKKPKGKFQVLGENSNTEAVEPKIHHHHHHHHHKNYIQVGNETEMRIGILSDRGLNYVASQIGKEWSMVVLINLGLSQAEIEQIKLDNPNQIVKQITRALILWRDKQKHQSEDELIESLLVTLKECGRADLVFDLQKKYGITEGVMPPEILTLDAKDVEIYRTALRNGKEKVYSTRVMIIGPFGVGKTTLAKRLLKQEFKMEDTQSTNGIEIHISRGIMNISDKTWIFQKESESKLPNCNDRLSRILSQPLQTVNVESVDRNQTSQEESDAKVLGESEKNLNVELETIVYTIDSSADSSEPSTSHSSTSIKNTAISDIEEEIIRHSKQNPKQLQEDLGEISIWDFGGQYDFYSTHQAFLSPRAIYLLVADITKGWKDEVEEDECYVDVSGCKYWETGDYILFWIKMISTYGSEGNEENGPPVVLIATHLDELEGEQVESKIESFFDGIRAGLRCNQTCCRHLVDEDYAINNKIEDPRLDDLRKKIVEIASSQAYWGEEIPASWIVLEKAFAQKRSDGYKILSFSEVMKINSTAVQPLSNEEEIKVFLKFQNALGNLIFYNEEELQDYIILEPQWLVDAFKCLITAKKFCTKQKNCFASQWYTFKQEGVLGFEMVDSIWQHIEEGRFYEHRHHLLKLLQKMDIIACPVNELDELDQQQGKFYYVPCVLENSVEDEYLSLIFEKTQNNTSYFCHVFENNFLPPAVFHRLVSALVGKWSLACQGKKRLIFCGCAIFKVNAYDRLVICMYSNVIQISIHGFSRPASDLVQICIKVRTFVKETLTKITSRFKQHLPWVEHIKCSRSFADFTSNKGLIKIEDLLSSQHDFLCSDHENSPSHMINGLQLLNCWFEDQDVQHLHKTQDDMEGRNLLLEKVDDKKGSNPQIIAHHVTIKNYTHIENSENVASGRGAKVIVQTPQSVPKETGDNLASNSQSEAEEEEEEEEFKGFH